MENFKGQIDLAALEMDHSPLVRLGSVGVVPPSLRDNTASVERLCRSVAGTLDLREVKLPLSLIPDLCDPETASAHDLLVTCHVEGDRGVIVTVEPDRGNGQAWGLAVDIGSTTLVMVLVDLVEARVVNQITMANPQVEHGADVLTRAHFAERPDGLEILSAGLRQAINRGASELCSRQGITPDRVAAATVAGNTVMTHFFLGLPVRALIREPYVPVINRPDGLRAGQIGLNLAPEAPVLVMPNKGSYLGGDLMAGLVVSGMSRAEGTCLLVDVGTNAEVVLGQKDWLIGAAGAAGPALEGGVARMGMVAGPGAIDRVRIDRETLTPSYRTMEDQPPRGICGSGLIDLYAELFLSGIIDFRGRLTLPPGHPRRAETDEGPAYVLVPAEQAGDGSPITLSEVEIDILTRSKAGMYTILNTVLLSVGVDFDDIDRFFMAGTFGQYIDPRMAVAVGMVPDLPLERFVPLGNSSLKGAVLSLLSARARAEINEVWQRLTYLEMNVNQDLMNRFSAARFLPHTERGLFPSVGTIIK